MKQAIAFFLMLLFALAADGLMDVLGPGKFLLAGGVVMGVVWALLWWGRYDEPQVD